MFKLFMSAGVKLLTAVVLLYCSYYVIIQSNFHYLFTGNLLLLTGLALLVESLEFFLFAFINYLKIRKTQIIGTSRSTFIIIFVVDVLIRLSGFVQTYSEQTDGNYFSQAGQEKLDSWYWIYSPNTHYINRKKEFVFERNTNSIGIAEKEIKKEKGSKFRILAIGDSFTEGVGTSYEDSWVKKMESRWKERNVQTINAGIGGSDPVYEFVLYRDKLLDYHPDLVVLTINSSDIFDIVGRGGFERFKEDGTAGQKAPSWEWIYASNHLFRMIMHGVFGYNSSLIKDTRSEENKSKSIIILKEAILRFDELRKEEETELLIVLQPTLQDFYNGIHKPFPGQTELAEYMERKGIHYVDVSEAFKEKASSISDYYYPLDTHFNKKGYALFGKTVYNKIESLEVWDN